MIDIERDIYKCCGCGCCQLTCPIWRRTRDTSLTAHGRLRAMQWGASVEEIARGIDECLLCGACEPVCPEENDLIAITLAQRRLLNSKRDLKPLWHPESMPAKTEGDSGTVHKPTIFIPGSFLSADDRTCMNIIKLLGGESMASIALNDGRGIEAFCEAGIEVASEIIEQFIAPLKEAKRLVVAHGAFIRHLERWLPKTRVISLGEALLSNKSIRRELSPRDLYIVESRSYHDNFNRMVTFYDRIIKETGVQANIDLNRVAIPTGASSLQGLKDMDRIGCIDQAKWILKGRSPERIVVEDIADGEILKRVTNIPVVHLSSIVSESSL